MAQVDLWLLALDGTRENPVAELQRVFGIDAALAREIEQTLPRAVKRNVTLEEATTYARALRAIGAQVECREARVNTSGRPPGMRSSISLAPPRVSQLPVVITGRPSSAGPATLLSIKPVVLADQPVVSQVPFARADALVRAGGYLALGVVALLVAVLQGGTVFLGNATVLDLLNDLVAFDLLGRGLFKVVGAIRYRRSVTVHPAWTGLALIFLLAIYFFVSGGHAIRLLDT